MRSVRRERMVFASEDWNSANEEVVASLENVLWYPASAPGSQNHNSKSYLALGHWGKLTSLILPNMNYWPLD